MADDSGLFAIEVDADDYATAAAGDAASHPRTYQSEADFQAQKASFTAKVDRGNIYANIVRAVPALSGDADTTAAAAATADEGDNRVKLSKQDVQLLGYAVGEMYFDREYEKILALCGKVKRVCEVEGVKGLAQSLERWEGRCRERLVEKDDDDDDDDDAPQHVGAK